MQRDDQDDLSEAFIEWYEAEHAVEETARSLVTAVRTLIDHRARYDRLMHPTSRPSQGVL